ncbi:FtsX-like permease family protein, partial [Actinotalea ferrariae]|uniref:FtsX-like permease family protein n=1 Tax=Actinotalea ferrariae TaxID=1386098 RepID=UPI001C8C9DBD
AVTSTATHRPVAVGRWRGETVPQLVAVDTASADALLRGRPPGGATWGELTSALGPETPAPGLPLEVAPSTGLTDLVLAGTGEGDGFPLRVTPTLVVEGGGGHRVTLVGEPLALDGAARAIVVPAQPGAVGPFELVGVRLALELDPQASVAPQSAASTRVSVTISGPTAQPGATWTAARGDRMLGLWSTAATSDDADVTATGTVGLGGLAWEPAELVITAFEAPLVVPVLVTEELAAATALRTGSSLTLSVGDGTVAAQVAGVVPYLPSVPRGPAVLADQDVLGRMLLARGDLTPLTDAWWVGLPATSTDDGAAAAAVEAAGLRVTADRSAATAALLDGPLRVGVPAVLAVLVAAALLLALAGTALHTAAAVDARALEVARLQGVGVPRRSVVSALVLENVALTVLVVVLGGGVGAAAAWAVAPVLATSQTGATPVPDVAVVWPWPAEVALLAAFVLLPAAVVFPMATRLVRRATADHLRLDGPG